MTVGDAADDLTLRPTRGARYAVDLVSFEGGRAVYRGAVHLPEASFPLEVVVDDRGAEARVDGPTEATVHAKPAAALVKAAAKLPRGEGAGPPPRRVVRWRDPGGAASPPG